MTNYKLYRLCTGIIMIALLFVVTTKMRDEFNDRKAYFSQLSGQEIPMEALADAYVEFDKLAAESLYRKIWTYNAMIVVSGWTIIFLLKKDD